MKTLIIMRHAKSSWADAGMSDHQRPLNGRGRRSSAIMAQRMEFHKNLPDLMLSSDSQRTRETMALLQENEAFKNIEVQFHNELYLASERSLISSIKNWNQGVDTLLILAHNPGVTELVNSISNARLDNLPTAGIACISFDIEDWEDLENKTGKLLWLEFPRMFE